jgi:hypothetical protein
MTEHDTAFDGDAVSRADRDFLTSLGDHPLVQDSLYGVPCPPCPAPASLGDIKAESEAQHAARERAFAEASTGCW